MFIDSFLKEHGINYTVHRSGAPDRIENGLPNHEKHSRKNYICFLPKTDIKAGDVLISSDNSVYYVTETETDYVHKEAFQLKAFYQTEQEHYAIQQAAGPVFNVQNAYGSVIGTNNQATINYASAISELKQAVSADTSGDKEQLDNIVRLLEMVVNDQVPPSRGLFSKFSEVMERHSWLSNSVAGAILSWLMTKIQ